MNMESTTRSNSDYKEYKGNRKNGKSNSISTNKNQSKRLSSPSSKNSWKETPYREYILRQRMHNKRAQSQVKRPSDDGI